MCILRIAYRVKVLLLELDLGVLLSGLAAAPEEESVRHAHDVGLVHRRHLVPPVVLGVLEGELGDARRRLLRDQLDGLHHAADDLVLDARVLALRVLADGDEVDVVVERLVALDRLARPHVGVEAEFLAERQVEGAEALADGRHERALEADLVPVDGVDGLLGDAHRAVGVLHRRHVHRLPLDWHVGRGEDPARKALPLREAPCERIEILTYFCTDFAISGPMPSPGMRVTFFTSELMWREPPRRPKPCPMRPNIFSQFNQVFS